MNLIFEDTGIVILTLRLLMSYTECPRRNVPDFGRVFVFVIPCVM